MRVSVDVTDEDRKNLDELAKAKGKTKAAVIRDALALEKWFHETQEEGGRILVERDGKAREIVRK